MIKSCMADVKAGKYKPSDAAKVVADGGSGIAAIKDAAGETPSIIVDPVSKKLILESEVVTDATDEDALSVEESVSEKPDSKECEPGESPANCEKRIEEDTA